MQQSASVAEVCFAKAKMLLPQQQKPQQLPHPTQPNFRPAFRRFEKGARWRVLRTMSKHQSTKQQEKAMHYGKHAKRNWQ
eukprot:10469581-Ditylum_brightwellii.AAC.1